MATQKKIVWILSDGTGRTALDVLKAASYQFEDPELEFRTLSDVTSEEKACLLIDRIRRESGMIVYTVVSL